METELVLYSGVHLSDSSKCCTTSVLSLSQAWGVMLFCQSSIWCPPPPKCLVCLGDPIIRPDSWERPPRTTRCFPSPNPNANNNTKLRQRPFPWATLPKNKFLWTNANLTSCFGLTAEILVMTYLFILLLYYISSIYFSTHYCPLFLSSLL